MTDTPVTPPPTRMERLKSFIGDLARPFSIVVTSASAAVTPVIVAVRAAPDRLDLSAASLFVGAIYAGVAGLYWGKAWEVRKQTEKAAEVEVAKVAAAPSAPPAPQAPPAPATETPPWERTP